jgi:SAM-dependent methyltransferase
MLRYFFKIRLFRYFYVLTRFLILVFIFKKLRTIKETKKSFKATTDRNLKSLLSLRDVYDGLRSEFFLNKLEKIENLDKIKKSKILLIGPRNEGEIYNFYSKGFLMKNITAIDLITYSKKIKAYDANFYLKGCKKKFDFIYFGFVLGYFKDPKKILSLAKKCLNKNGYVVVTVEAPVRIIDKRKNIEKTIGFYDLKSLDNNFSKKLKHVYSTSYIEKLYFIKPLFIKCYLVIKKKINIPK